MVHFSAHLVHRSEHPGEVRPFSVLNLRPIYRDVVFGDFRRGAAECSKTESAKNEVESVESKPVSSHLLHCLERQVWRHRTTPDHHINGNGGTQQLKPAAVAAKYLHMNSGEAVWCA